MNRFMFAFLLAVSSIALMSHASVVRQCEGGPRQLNDDEVTISNCNKGRCRLRRNSEVSIKMKLNPDHKVKSLTTSVYATIAGIPLPFIGVDGSSACDNIYSEDGTTKLGCPLEANKNYLYKRSFDVLSIYPKIQALDVHWALTERNNKNLVCFEIPAKIT